MEDGNERTPRPYIPPARPENGEVVAVEWGGQMDFAEYTEAGDDHAALETMDGRHIGGRVVEDLTGVKLACPGGPVRIQRAGTHLPGYARAVEHFEERRSMELEEKARNKDLDDWLREVNEGEG